MKIIKLIFVTVTLLLCQPIFAADSPDSAIKIVKDMFKNFSEKQDMKRFDDYYTKDFVLESNNEQYDQTHYKKQQAEIFKTLKSLKVTQYEDVFSDGDHVAGRVRIRLIKNDGKIYNFYVLFIAHIKEHKIDHFWEMTDPSWRDKLPAGQEAS